MNKSRQAGMIVLVLTTLIACTLSSTSTAVPVATEGPLSASTPAPERLPFEGMWMSEDDAPEIIVFTRDSMYQVGVSQTNPDQPYAHEQFAEIVSYDLENNHVSLRMQWIRVAGLMRGFDDPNFTITYLVDGDTLRIGLSWDEDFATETDPLVYHRR